MIELKDSDKAFLNMANILYREAVLHASGNCKAFLDDAARICKTFWTIYSWK